MEDGQLHDPVFTRGEAASGTHWIGDWIGPTADLKSSEKIICPLQKSNRDTAVVQPVPYSLHRVRFQESYVHYVGMPIDIVLRIDIRFFHRARVFRIYWGNSFINPYPAKVDYIVSS